MLSVVLLASITALMGPGKLTLMMIGALASLFLFAVSTGGLLYIFAVMVFLVIGQLMYFAGINQALWVAFGIAGLLFFRIPSVYLNSPIAKTRLGLPLLFPLLFFFFVFVVSIAINAPPMLQIIVGGKNLVMFWSVFMVIALFAISFSTTERLFRYLIPMVFLQIPFVLYQYFIVAPKRSNAGGRMGVSWDAIVGGYGGDPSSGGASGTMAFMLILGILLAISLYRYKQMSMKLLGAVVVCALFCVALAEVKVVVVLLPVGIAILYWKDLVRRPLKAVVSLFMALVVGLGILVLYEQVHPAAPGQQAHDISSLLDRDFGYSLDSRLINMETGEMGRNAAIVFWWDEGFKRDPLRGVLGYGPGASRSASSLAVGEVARKYHFGIDRSAATQLLWDIGLAGFGGYVFIMISGICLALRNATACTSATGKAVLEAAAAGLAMGIIMLPYSRDVLEVPATSFLIVFLLGMAAQAEILRRLQHAPFNHA